MPCAALPSVFFYHAYRGPFQLQSARFRKVWSRQVLLIYSPGRGLVPLPPVGVCYVVGHFNVGHVWPYGTWRPEFPSRCVVLPPTPPSTLLGCGQFGVLPVGWLWQQGRGGVGFCRLGAF